jgi:alpha-L-rhamnosidase
VQYQTYDVTGWLQTGEKNILSVRLGEGWYCGRIARRDRGRISYGDQPLLKAELHLETSDGEKQVVITDENWEYRPGSILLSDIYDGEHECAFLRDPAWESSFEVHPWVTVFNKELSIVWQSGAPVRPVMILKPESIRKRSSGTYIVDFGQNFTGRERITLKGAHAGDVIRIRHGEMLYDNGALYTENLRTSCAASIYEANDEPVQIYEPEFTFFGFRYLEICGWNGELTPDCIEGVVLASDLPQTGKFRCSNELLNQLYSNIVWGQRSNFLDIPSDCPQRDERVAWTGDTQVFCNVATYNMFSAEFYRKWIDDLNLSRDSRGAYPIVAPIQYENWGEGGTVSGWSDAALIVPWQMYLKYGDKKLLEQYFGNMETYLDNQVELAGGYIVDYARFGDWLNIDAPTSSPLISTAYLAGMNRLLARIARVLGKNDAAEKREEIAGKISHACRERFLTSDGELTEKTQTAALFFLHFDIVQEKAARQKIFDFLVADIFETRQGHLSTGFLGTPLLLRVLTENGRSDLAYKLLLQTTYPGWLYPVTQGATTMWERWNSWTKEDGFASRDMNSFNHYAYGAVGEWFYETICGIQPLEEGEGFQKFRLAPEPGGGLTFAEAEYHSMYGMIRSSWEIRDNKLLWHFTVPCNTSAEIVFPGELLEPLPPGIEQNGKKGSATAGNYTLVFKFNN